MDSRVAAIRADVLVGAGTCSVLEECWEDSDLAEFLDRNGITSDVEAVKQARQAQLMFLEEGTNQSSGEPNCPLVASYRAFKERLDAAS